MATPAPRNALTPVPGEAGGVPMAPALARAIDRRKQLIDQRRSEAFRVFSGDSEGVPGVFIDVYGPGAAMMVYDGRTPRGFDAVRAAQATLETLKPLGVRAVYIKPFPKDRTKLGGGLPACATDPMPAAGEPLPEVILIREVDWQLEVRLFDGLSTGLFLDQRENRAALAQAIARRMAKAKLAAVSTSHSPPPTTIPPSVLNTFAYTCAFSVATAKAGAATTSVDVSGRYLDWGKRNFVHNGLDPALHRFAKMDTFEFFAYAQRKGLRYDLIILDPPSFASGSKKKGFKTFSSVADYSRLVLQARTLVNPGGAIFASTNTLELCRSIRPGQPIGLEREIVKGLGLPPGKAPRWLKLPAPPPDCSMERERFAARFFTV